MFFSMGCDAVLCKYFGVRVGPKTLPVGPKAPRGAPKTFPRPSKSRPRSSPRPRNSAFQHRGRKFLLFCSKIDDSGNDFFMLLWHRCHIIFVLYWHKLIFKKCTKTLCFSIVFEDRPFWLQHQIILKVRCKRHGNKLSFSASCGHGFFIDFSMILGSFCDPKSM